MCVREERQQAGAGDCKIELLLVVVTEVLSR